MTADGAGTSLERDTPPPVVHETLVYSAVRLLVLILARVVFRCRVGGGAHVPVAGPLVLVANHQSMIDIPLLAQATRRHVCFVARDSLARRRWLAGLMRQCGAVLIRRGTPDLAGMREIAAHLEHGDCVAFFPEGTRSRDEVVGRFRGGAVLAARRSGAPVVPVAIRGSGRAWPSGAYLPRVRRVSLTFGAPIASDTDDALQRVEDAVRALLEQP